MFFLFVQMFVVYIVIFCLNMSQSTVDNNIAVNFSETECDLVIPPDTPLVTVWSYQCYPRKIRHVTVGSNSYVNIILLDDDNIHGDVTVGERAVIFIASQKKIPVMGSVTAGHYSQVCISSPTQHALQTDRMYIYKYAVVKLERERERENRYRHFF